MHKSYLTEAGEKGPLTAGASSRAANPISLAAVVSMPRLLIRDLFTTTPEPTEPWRLLDEHATLNTNSPSTQRHFVLQNSASQMVLEPFAIFQHASNVTLTGVPSIRFYGGFPIDEGVGTPQFTFPGAFTSLNEELRGYVFVPLFDIDGEVEIEFAATNVARNTRTNKTLILSHNRTIYTRGARIVVAAVSVAATTELEDVNSYLLASFSS